MQTKLDIHEFWTDQIKGSKQSIWLKSHVCLSRNLNGFPFSNQTTSDQRNTIVKQLQKAIKTIPTFPEKFVTFDWYNCSEHEQSLLKELCYLQNPCDETRIWLNTKEKYWCVSNDGDHLRLHMDTQTGNLKRIWKKLDTLDSVLEHTLFYAFDPEMGYATCEPEAYGTGLSVMATVHVPGMCFMQKLPQITEALNEMALSINAQQMANAKPLGHLFTVTNKTALGCSEIELINHIEHQIHRFIEIETRTRYEVFQQNTNFLKDSIGRSLGLLKNCFELNFEESMNLLSLVRMAIDLGLIDTIKPESLTSLWNIMSLANLKAFCSKDCSINDENCVRADIVRAFFAKISNLSLKNNLKEVSYVS